MANDSLNHFSSFVNQQMGSIETINDHLCKANSLIQVALHGSFLHYPKALIHNYLLVLSDLLENAIDCSKESLAAFDGNYEEKQNAVKVKMSRRWRMTTKIIQNIIFSL